MFMIGYTHYTRTHTLDLLRTGCRHYVLIQVTCLKIKSRVPLWSFSLMISGSLWSLNTDFDVILGMDWLSAHQASVMCAKKQIKVIDDEGKELIYQADIIKQAKRVLISTLQAMKLLENGCQGYLTSMIDLYVEVTPLEEVEAVKEFPYVFPDDLTQLPSDRELEFAVDLIPGAAPLSKAPYRMEPTELKEL
ncbi:uncharacterized protein LOC122080685 isoform X2 [Macadamia integrifolia]|uniref:uncharacterized protein LOC122080685 isoform X2 n=1 Tax=Macadamia integrifolia TaxID=60698 RepID=UPI001C4F1AC6|nr:uncharacterized protein LOC122080685 isoform X2 [Macadamia integrifolia]